MKDFDSLAERLVAEFDAATSCTISDTAREFVELLTFATPEDIVEMLHHSISKDVMGLPIWVRNLAYRLACLQRPEDAQLLREASRDLYLFGPDWDDISASLEARANHMDPEGT